MCATWRSSESHRSSPINRFATDTEEELEWLLSWCAGEGIEAAVADVWGAGRRGFRRGRARGQGARGARRTQHFLTCTRSTSRSRTRSARSSRRSTAPTASISPCRRFAGLPEIEANGWGHLPVCMAKTQYSFSDDPAVLGAPKGFTVHVRDLITKTGAGFIVALTGTVMTMPGLPKDPAAMRMDVDDDGDAVGLF